MKRNIKLLLTGIVMSASIAGTVLLIGNYQKTHRKYSAEVIQQAIFSENSVLVSGEEGNLFFFNLPENSPENLQPGALIRITGTDYMLYSFPAQLPYVKKVEITGMRPDFIQKYYNTFLQKENITENDVRALDDLNEAEKAGLCYLLHL